MILTFPPYKNTACGSSTILIVHRRVRSLQCTRWSRRCRAARFSVGFFSKVADSLAGSSPFLLQKFSSKTEALVTGCFMNLQEGVRSIKAGCLLEIDTTGKMQVED
jgi:hypothetical protein